MPEAPSTDLRMKPRDLILALIVSLTIVAVTAITVSAFVEDEPPAPVARVTTGDLRAMADIARAIQHNPRSTPGQVRTAGRLIEVVDAVENGEVEVVPESETVATTALSTPAPPPTTTTTTTTTPPPPTTVAPVHVWPTDSDAPLVTVP